MNNENPELVAQDIETGEYYQNARRWYSELFHRPIAERSYYLIVILLAFINGYFAILSVVEVFPLRVKVPFITYSQDVWQELPLMIPIKTVSGEDPNTAMVNFLLKSYVEHREAYDDDLSRYEMRFFSVYHQSTPEVFARYNQQMDASNPYSPYRLYSKEARRAITIDSVVPVQSADTSVLHAAVTFHASVFAVVDNREIKQSRYEADIAYLYSDFVVDQTLDRHSGLAYLFGLTQEPSGDSGERDKKEPKVVPMKFVVTDYQVKELLE